MPGTVQKALVGLTAAAMLFGSLVITGSASAASQGASAFTDVTASTPHAQAINFIAAAGLVGGVGGGLYDPSGPVTRAQMAKIVVDMLGDASFASAMSYTTPSFTDASTIPSWATGYVNVASALGIVNGFPDGSFQPNGPVTEVEAVAMILRALNDNTYVTTNWGTQWPGNYVVAAFNTTLGNGVANGLVHGLSNFFANLPANRGEIAQLVYNAGVNEYANADQACTGTPSACKAANVYEAANPGSLTPIWQGEGVSGLQVIEGPLSGFTNSTITVNGTNYNLNNNFQVLGADSLQSLVNMPVIVVTDGNKNVSAVELSTTTSSSLKTATLAINNPNGYTLLNGDYEVNNSSGKPALQLSNHSLLNLSIDSSTGTILTKFYVNTPTTGVSSDNGNAAADVTKLNNGDSIAYTLNPDGTVAAVYDTHVTYADAIITNVYTSYGHHYININAANGTGYTKLEEQGFTQVNLDGVASSWSNLAKNQVANIEIVGGYAAGKGDSNVAVINAYDATATGTVVQVNQGTNGHVSSFVLQNASGTQTTYDISGNYQGGVSQADAVLLPNGAIVAPTKQFIVRLDGSGKVVDLVQVGASLQAGWVTGISEVYNQSTSGTTYYANINTGSGSVTVDLGTNNTGLVPGGLASGAKVVTSTNQATAQVTVLSAYTATSGNPWYVVSTSSNSVVIADSATPGPGSQYVYVTGSSNAVVDNTGDNLGYSGMASGNVVKLYEATVAGSTFWVVQDTNK